MTVREDADGVCAGLIGIGNMGGAIARRLLAVGVDLHVNDLDPAKLAEFAALGAHIHDSPRAVADAAGIVFVCLPSVAASRAVIGGDSGLLKGSKLSCIVEMSTIGPAVVAELATLAAATGKGLLDAPVSGGAQSAEAGTLTVLLAGEDRLVAEAMPVLSRLSSRILTVGRKPGDGQAMKLINNILATANLTAAFEAIALAEKLGIAPKAVVDAVSQSSGQSYILSKKASEIISGNFGGGGVVSVLEKDAALALDLAQAAGIAPGALGTLTAAAALWRDGVGEGMADLPVTELIQLVRARAGLVEIVVGTA